MRRIFFTRAAEFTLRLFGLLRPSRRPRPATSCASSIRSATRKSARRFPMEISGSGTTVSVHCGGTEQTVSASTCNRSRLPYRLYRSATQASCRPLSGWNGCVTRTRRVVPFGASAFRIELQTPRHRDISDSGTGDRGRRRATDRRACVRRPARWHRHRAVIATSSRPLTWHWVSTEREQVPDQISRSRTRDFDRAALCDPIAGSR